MKKSNKILTSLLALSIAITATSLPVTAVHAEEFTNVGVNENSLPQSLASENEIQEEISSYSSDSYEINPNYTVEFVDPVLVLKNANSQVAKQKDAVGPLAGDRRVYEKTGYAIGNMKIAGYSVGPLTNQVHLVSVAKGKTETVSKATTVTGSLQVTGSFNTAILKLVRGSLELSATGTISKTYTTSTTYQGPPESSGFNTRDYYAAIDYDLYNITVVRYDYYREYIGNTYVGTVADNMGYTYLNNTKRPKNIEYSKDFNRS
ncbi:hypothetical protein [Paenibacillus cucumis (ex Kampfer et al. 2016)]|uniref:Uncharacterized protein n=1 Tax=Paenibacillus cucumis (ex Kampfer et al. 2016) TaxID=1776858 RepID=A0ABS7KRR1_9BACL|nr:hypothetical protein [Paenibacillus cucumis (ex Kampfer et al. 2016)]MBY0206774.1 hypothetical protein [Paenibacillus cucumis (ex Kampfer et al. 2016)]